MKKIKLIFCIENTLFSLCVCVYIYISFIINKTIARKRIFLDPDALVYQFRSIRVGIDDREQF